MGPAHSQDVRDRSARLSPLPRRDAGGRLHHRGPRHPPHPRPPWRLGSPRYPGPRSASHGRLNPSPAISRAAAEDRSYDPSLLCPPSGARSTEPARSPRTPNKRLEVPHDPVPGPAEAPVVRNSHSLRRPARKRRGGGESLSLIHISEP